MLARSLGLILAVAVAACDTGGTWDTRGYGVKAAENRNAVDPAVFTRDERIALGSPWARSVGTLSAPAWSATILPVHLDFAEVPHLRTNFCAGSFSYDVGSDPSEIAERAISVGTEIVRVATSGGMASPARAVSTARPVIEGIDPQGRPLSDLGHPALITDWNTNHRPAPAVPSVTPPIGDGLSPYGINTGIRCSVIPGGDTCDRERGLICGLRIGFLDTCIAYPIVQRSGAVVLRGWNFWDEHDAQLRLVSIDDSGAGGFANMVSVAANEGFPPIDPCSRATRDNLTHNTASFPLTVSSGFYRLTMFNHNGHYYTQDDMLHVSEDPPGRTIHVCWPDEAPGLEPVEAVRGTVRGCTPTTSTCGEDGVLCSMVWSREIPRPLSECRHLLNTMPACGETPEWMGSEPKWVEDSGILVRHDAIVFVRSGPAPLDASVGDAGGATGDGGCVCAIAAGVPTATPTVLLLSMALGAFVRARRRLRRS